MNRGKRRDKDATLKTEDDILRSIAELPAQERVPHDDMRRLYHLDRPVCKGCRINSKDNPNCFCAFVPATSATRKQGLWMKETDIFAELGEDPRANYRSSADQFVGLSNLGATCYVNSVLQCLYMNRRFRSGIFSVESNFLAKNPVLFQLAKVFTQLQMGKELVVDTKDFAQTLQLNSGVQQDGTEFMNLLLEHLEAKLAGSQIGHACSLVQALFRGKYNYATRCEECQQESERSKCDVDFYQLEINVHGMAGLEQGLDDLLQKEFLTGANQYKCDHCCGERDAVRWIRLRFLPPVLNFCLKRFVFNPLTMMRNKVMSAFRFPVAIDMGPRLRPDSSEAATSNGSQGPVDDNVYDLTAILLHKGAAAISGHYTAHVRDQNTGKWWKFDDEDVSLLGDHPLGKSKKVASPQAADPKANADTGNSSGGANKDPLEPKGESVIKEVETVTEPEANNPVVTLSDSEEDTGAKEKGKRKRSDVGAPQVSKKVHVESAEEDPATTEELPVNVLSSLASAEAYMLMYTRRGTVLAGSFGEASEVYPLTSAKSIAAREMDVGGEVPGEDAGADVGSVLANGQAAMDTETNAANGLEPPPQVMLEVEVKEANESLLARAEEYKRRREGLEKEVKERREEVRDILEKAPVTAEDESYYFITTDWLRSWADNTGPPPPIDLSGIKCSHSKLHPSRVTAVRCISPVAWMQLESKYSVTDNFRLGEGSLCESCVRESASATTSADSFRNERLKVRTMLEKPSMAPAGTRFLISRQWLANWHKRKGDAPVEADAGPTAPLTCPHGQLLPEHAPSAKRQIVPGEAWEYFKQVAWQVESQKGAALCKEFAESAESCTICEVEISNVRTIHDEIRGVKTEERQRFDSLVAGRPIVLEKNKIYACVPMHWVQRWRAYLKDTKAAIDRPKNLSDCMESLRCMHGRLSVMLPDVELRGRSIEWVQKTNNEGGVLVIPWDDWAELSFRYGVAPDLGVRVSMRCPQTAGAVTAGRGKRSAKKKPSKEDDCVELANGHGSETHAAEGAADAIGKVVPYLESEPEVCKQCMEEQQSIQFATLLSYTNRSIFVELVKGKKPPPSVIDATSHTSRAERRSKRRKASNSSGRRQLTVSADTTVAHLKLLIWEALSVVKENQRIGFGKTELLDDSARLGDEKVFPDAHLWVVDTGQHEDRDIAEELIMEEEESGEFEEGFAGTGLRGGLYQSPSPPLAPSPKSPGDPPEEANDEKLSNGEGDASTAVVEASASQCNSASIPAGNPSKPVTVYDVFIETEEGTAPMECGSAGAMVEDVKDSDGVKNMLSTKEEDGPVAMDCGPSGTHGEDVEDVVLLEPPPRDMRELGARMTSKGRATPSPAKQTPVESSEQDHPLQLVSVRPPNLSFAGGGDEGVVQEGMDLHNTPEALRFQDSRGDAAECGTEFLRTKQPPTFIEFF